MEMVRLECADPPALTVTLAGLIVNVRPGEEAEGDRATVPAKPAKLASVNFDTLDPPARMVKNASLSEMTKSPRDVHDVGGETAREGWTKAEKGSRQSSVVIARIAQGTLCMRD